MTSYRDVHIPGTEPTPEEIDKVRPIIRRDRIRHRLTNVASRVTSLSHRTVNLTDEEATAVEQVCTALERVLDR